jgi:hypothetical protein
VEELHLSAVECTWGSGNMQKKIRTAKTSLSEPSNSEAEVVNGKMETHKPPGAEQIPWEMIQAGGKKISV